MTVYPHIKLILISSPVFVSILFYYLIKLFVKHKKKAFHMMISWTAFMYIIAVVLLLQDILNISLIGIIPIVIILMLAIILTVQWKVKTEVILTNGLKVMWRLCFLIFIPAYIGLIGYVIIAKYILV